MLLRKPDTKEWNWTSILQHLQRFFKKSKQIKDLNIRPETLELLKENSVVKLLDIGLGDNFLDLTPKKSNQSKNK